MAIFCLIGHSASGKSTIESLLEKKGYPRIITYTTRPMRPNEVDGVAYHFVSDDEFLEMKARGLFQETARYREWNYGLSLNGIDYINKDYVAVVTRHGYEEIAKAVGKEYVYAIFIDVPERTRMIRLLHRGDEIDEVIRRIQNDRIDFAGMEEVADYILEKEDLDISVMQLESIAKGALKKY